MLTFATYKLPQIQCFKATLYIAINVWVSRAASGVRCGSNKLSLWLIS